MPTPPCPCAPTAAQVFESDWITAVYSRAAGSSASVQSLKMLGGSGGRPLRTARIAEAWGEAAATVRRVCSATATLRRWNAS